MEQNLLKSQNKATNKSKTLKNETNPIEKFDHPTRGKKKNIKGLDDSQISA